MSHDASVRRQRINLYWNTEDPVERYAALFFDQLRMMPHETRSQWLRDVLVDQMSAFLNQDASQLSPSLASFQHFARLLADDMGVSVDAASAASTRRRRERADPSSSSLQTSTQRPNDQALSKPDTAPAAPEPEPTARAGDAVSQLESAPVEETHIAQGRTTSEETGQGTSDEADSQGGGDSGRVADSSIGQKLKSML